MTEFKLIFETTSGKKITFGKMFFNGKFVFELDESIPVELWERIGIFPISKESKRIEATELFEYLNDRLPIRLRKADKDEKIEYIEKSGLRVPSDNFFFSPA